MTHEDILLEFDTIAAPILTRRWAHSPSVDEPIGFEDYTTFSGLGSGAERSMFADRQGSILWVTEPATGAVLAAYEYGGFGEITQTQGVLLQPYGYTGRELDTESGLYHYRARTYDPNGGYFLQSDPVKFEGGQFSLYQYAASNPFGFTDPEGLNSTIELGQGTLLSQAESLHTNSHLFAGMAGLAGSVYNYLMKVKVLGARITPKSIPRDYGICDVATQNWLDSLKPHVQGKCASGREAVVANLIKMGLIQKEIWVRSLELSMCYDGGDRGDRGHVTRIAILFKTQKDCRRRIRNAMTPANNRKN